MKGHTSEDSGAFCVIKQAHDKEAQKHIMEACFIHICMKHIMELHGIYNKFFQELLPFLSSGFCLFKHFLNSIILNA